MSEHAAGPRGLDTFPDEWGWPPGRRYSEERASWVRRHARVEQCRSLLTSDVRDAKREHEAAPRDARLAQRLARALGNP